MTWVWKLKGFGAAGNGAVSPTSLPVGMANDGERKLEPGEEGSGEASCANGLGGRSADASVSSNMRIGGGRGAVEALVDSISHCSRRQWRYPGLTMVVMALLGGLLRRDAGHVDEASPIRVWSKKPGFRSSSSW